MKVQSIRYVTVKDVSGKRFGSHDECEFHYVISGCGTFYNGEKEIPICDGAIFFSPANLPHKLHLKSKHTVASFYFLRFEPENNKEALSLLKKKFKDGDVRLILGEDKRAVFEEIRRKFASEDKLLQKSASFQLLSFIFDVCSEIESLNPKIEKALRIMRQKAYEPYSIADVAKEVHINKSYFIRLFKSATGTTPVKYITKVRIDAACYLLKETDMPIYKISEHLQFSDEFYFSRKFKEYTGSSPSSYRKAHY